MLVKLAQQRGWTVQLTATPAAVAFIDIVAPATYNMVCKCGLGISDTYALGILAEAVSLPIPVVMLPFINTALASRRPIQDAVGKLTEEGVRILLGPGEFQPHPPGAGSEQLASFPWQFALDETERLASE